MKRSRLERRTSLKPVSEKKKAQGFRWSTLNPVSAKRQRQNRQRTELLREPRIYPQVCAVPWCTNVGDSPHEPLTRARGGSITDPANIVMVCWPHNQELTLEPPWAYELGLLVHSWDGGAA